MIAWCVVNNMMQSLLLACAPQSPRVTPNYALTHTPQFILMKMMIFGQHGSIFKIPSWLQAPLGKSPVPELGT